MAHAHRTYHHPGSCSPSGWINVYSPCRYSGLHICDCDLEPAYYRHFRADVFRPCRFHECRSVYFSHTGTRLSWTPWITMPLGAVATMIVAVVLGYPFSRLRTFYFSMVSLFAGIGILAVNTIFSKYTGGGNGLAGIPPLFFVHSKVPFYFFFWAWPS